jgi:triosephosphate isomerase
MHEAILESSLATPQPIPMQEALDAALEADFQTLVCMGFSRRKAGEALQACDGDVQAACEWLFSN